MPGRSTKKFSAKQESEFRMRALGVISESEEALTIDEIKSRDFTLQSLSTQKMSRILGYLVEMGFIRKAKSKSLNRMVYKSVAVMAAQGYDVEGPFKKDYTGLDWELEEEIICKGADEDGISSDYD